MRVVELEEVSTLDQTIQQLLKDLQDLYGKRQAIVEPKKSGKKPKKNQANEPDLDDIALEELDLTLPETGKSKPKRFKVLSKRR